VRLVILIVAALGGMATIFSWSVASPSGAAPDEGFHDTSIWCPPQSWSQECQTRISDTGDLQVAVPKEVAAAQSCFAFHAEVSGHCVLGLSGEEVWEGHFNKGTYPGGFYDVMHLFVGSDVYSSVVVMRCFNGVLALGLFLVLAWLLPRDGRRLMAWSLFAVSVPLLIYLVCSTNPSSWSITGMVVGWFGAYAAFASSTLARQVVSGALAVVGAVMAAMARSDSGAYVALAGLAVVIVYFATLRKRVWMVAIPGAMVVIGLIGFFSGGQTSVLSSGLAETSHTGSWGSFMYNLAHLPQFMVDYSAGWFGLNWLDTPMPPVVWVSVVAVSVALVFLGLRWMDWRKGLVLVGMLLVYMGLPLLILQRNGDLMGSNVQPRYVLPLVPLILAMALWRPRRGGAPSLTWVQTGLMYVCVVVAQAVALHVQLRRFVTGTDVTGFNLNRQVEWWHPGPSPMATWLIGAVGFALLSALLFMVRTGRGATPTVDRDAAALAKGTDECLLQRSVDST
jgi:hypothetical protein